MGIIIPGLGKVGEKEKKLAYRYPKQGNGSYGICDGYSWLTITEWATA